MKDKNVYFYVAAALAVIVPVPGRFAFGLIMVLLFNVQILTCLLFCHLISFLKLDDLKNVLVAVELVAVTIFFKQVLILYCPVAALTLGFLLYLPALSSAFIEFCYKDTARPLAEDLRPKVRRNLIFSVAALVIYLVRDIVGYGTITLPAGHRISSLHLAFISQTTHAGAFVATIPGSFVLIALILAVYLLFIRQFDKIERTEESQ